MARRVVAAALALLPALTGALLDGEWMPDMNYVQIDVKKYGSIIVELDPSRAPVTVENFLEYVGDEFYDGTIFHRVVRGFMVQGGDPSGTGRGGESIYGGKFRDEVTRELKHVGAGVLSMANTGRDTNGSQFFTTLAPTPWLDGKHTIFGRVAAGMGTIRKCGMVQTDGNDRPTSEIKVFRAYPAATPDMPTKSNAALVATRTV